MKLDYVIETLEPKRDRLFNENKRIQVQIKTAELMLKDCKEKYEINECKIKQIDHVLDQLVYEKEPSIL